MADDLKTFSIDDARKIALDAQGFAESRPHEDCVGIADIERVARRLNIVQIDSVNVLVRAQYMPFFSRLGPTLSTCSIDTRLSSENCSNIRFTRPR